MKVTVQVIKNRYGDFTASCPALPGCMSRAETPEEACAKLDDAIRGYIAAVSNFVPDRVTHEFMEA